MIDIHNLIGKFAVGLFPLGGQGSKIFVWAAFEIKHYRDHETFPSCYKIQFCPVGIFAKHVTKDSFYTHDLTLKEPGDLKSYERQPEEWGPFYIFETDNVEFPILWAMSMNNERMKQGFFPETLPLEFKLELGKLGALAYKYMYNEPKKTKSTPVYDKTKHLEMEIGANRSAVWQ